MLLSPARFRVTAIASRGKRGDHQVVPTFLSHYWQSLQSASVAHQNHAVHAVTARSSMHVKHITYQQAFPLKSGVAAVCLRRDPESSSVSPLCCGSRGFVSYVLGSRRDERLRLPAAGTQRLAVRAILTPAGRRERLVPCPSRPGMCRALGADAGAPSTLDRSQREPVVVADVERRRPLTLRTCAPIRHRCGHRHSTAPAISRHV